MVTATTDLITQLQNLHFHPYNPADIKQNELERSIIVFDIPFHQLKGAFSRSSASTIETSNKRDAHSAAATVSEWYLLLIIMTNETYEDNMLFSGTIGSKQIII